LIRRELLHILSCWLLLLPFAACSRRANQSTVTETATATTTATESLRFIAPSHPARTLTKQQLLAQIPSQIIAGRDPYYERVKRFTALPLRAVLSRGFADAGVDLAKEDLVLRALDGYEVPISGALLLDENAYLAVADLDAPQWEPIGPRRSSPAPFYLIWKGDDKMDLMAHPRPWALHEIEIAHFEKLYPHLLPPEPQASENGGLARRGLDLFRRECIRCHAINREGGRIGPELNVPRSIVEYRPVEQIRAYIRNPQSFRYSAMPAHPQLDDTDLDALIAYFRLMSQNKHDRDAVPATTPSRNGNSVVP